MNLISKEQHNPPQDELEALMKPRSPHPFLVILFSVITLVNLVGLILDLKYFNKNADLIIYTFNVVTLIIIPMVFAIHIQEHKLLENSAWIAMIAAIVLILIVLGAYPSSRQNPFYYASIFLNAVSLFYLQKHPDVLKDPDPKEEVTIPRLMVPIVVLTIYGVLYLILYTFLIIAILIFHDQIGNTLDYSPIVTSIVLPLFLAYGLWKCKKWAFNWALWYSGLIIIFGVLTFTSSRNIIIQLSIIFFGWSFIVLWRNKSVYQPKTPAKDISAISYPADDDPDTEIPGPLDFPDSGVTNTSNTSTVS